MQTYLEPVEQVIFVKPIISPTWVSEAQKAGIIRCVTHCLNIRIHRRKPCSAPTYIGSHQTHEMECFVTRFAVVPVFESCHLDREEAATVCHVRCNGLANMIP
jgi:hypothetical protein